MVKKTKFKPDFKYKVGQYALVPLFYWNFGSKQLVRCIVRIYEHKVYNRNNTKYVVKRLDIGEKWELSKEHLEQEGVVGPLATLKTLYGKPQA